LESDPNYSATPKLPGWLTGAGQIVSQYGNRLTHEGMGSIKARFGQQVAG